MNISFSGIGSLFERAGAQLGTTARGVADTAQTVTGGGLAPIGQTAATLQTAATTAVPATSQAGIDAAAKATAGVAALEKPARAIANVAPEGAKVASVAGFLGKALPIIAIASSAYTGANVVEREGKDGLVNTTQGRSAVLGALGGSLLLVPTPVTQIAAAGVLGVAAVNHFGGLKALDGVMR